MTRNGVAASAPAVQMHDRAPARGGRGGEVPWAQERRYYGIHTAIGYRGDPNPVYDAEATALFAWRSAVWAYATAELEKVQEGLRSVPTVRDFMAELPPFE
nr:hypothetical protein [Nitratireductor luteus]